MILKKFLAFLVQNMYKVIYEVYINRLVKEKLENEFIYRDLENQLREIIGTKVTINPKTNKKGKMTTSNHILQIVIANINEIKKKYLIVYSPPIGKKLTMRSFTFANASSNSNSSIPSSVYKCKNAFLSFIT